ncbi:hypothetical protein ACGFXC_34900 [Streptomyces sp. NPDC048507]|uniref:hypothetical protein n=1 Tax=Streptomyces sp. NPDC048507 TaxID=3365560 RepID=UPI00372361B3
MQNNDEIGEHTGEARLSAAEAEELFSLMSDLGALMVSVKVEAETPVAGAAVRLAERIRTRLGQPDCRIQDDNDGADAVLGPVSGCSDDPGSVLRAAMTALGGIWGDVTVTTNSSGPVHYVIRAAEQSPQGDGPTRIHLWAASGWALVRSIENLS